MNDYYRILEVEPNASQEQIKSQYRFLAQAWHPDKFGSPEGKAKAEEKLKQINEAFSVLKDVNKRAEYDRQRAYYQSKSNGQSEYEYEQRRREQEAKERAEAERREREQREAQERAKKENTERESQEQTARKNAAREGVGEKKKQKKQPQTSLSWVGVLLGLFTLTLVLASIYILFAIYLENGNPTASPPVEDPSLTEVPIIRAPTEIATESMRIETKTMIGNDGATLVYIPEGDFIMGSDNDEADESPIHVIYLNAFWIDQIEVTNAMYAKCVHEGLCEQPEIYSSSRSSYYGNSNFDNYPVIHIFWDAAVTYCKWAGRRLPTEAEWEKAARGTDGRTYPWGENISCDKGNYYDGDKNCVGDTAKARSYESGRSPYGVYDMAGNVWEWTSSLYKTYPYVFTDGRENRDSSDERTLRGGSWSSYNGDIRVANREPSRPDSIFGNDYGFRCAQSAISADTLPVKETMVIVPAGEFPMGYNGPYPSAYSDAMPVHTVYLDEFIIDQTEVTNIAYRHCVDSGICEMPMDIYEYADSAYAEHPVVYVNWGMANAYCEWRGARLPTEAEWEKAARGIDGRTYPWGENIDCDKASYVTDCGWGTKKVGSYESGRSPYGAYDMAGNVGEWVNDWFGYYYQISPLLNPTGPDTGEYKVIRGGGWNNGDGGSLSANRSISNPNASLDSVGFRCVRSP